MIRCFIISILLCLGVGTLFSQTASNAIDRKYKRATELYKKGQTKKADGVLKDIIALNPKYAEIYSKIGQFYFDNNRFLDAAYYFEMGSKSVPNGKEVFAIPLAKSFFRAGVPEKASIALRYFKTYTHTPATMLEEVKQLQSAIDYSKLVSFNTHKVVVENLRWPVNSEFDDYAPHFSPVKSDLVFTRRINGLDENFFQSTLDTCMLWSEAEDMGMPLNSIKPESYQTRSYSTKYMVYQKCDNRSVNGWEQGGCDLYLSYATKQGWSDPQPFGYTINSTAFEGMPSLNADETALFFVSDRPGGFGGKDIWVSYFEKGRWQVPQNLGPGINTEKDEIAPSIAADGKTLFFSSNGRVGLGGFDVFTSKMQEDSSWIAAENLGMPINTPYNEMAGSVDLEGKFFYLSSDRPGGYGGLDIYKAEIPERFAPNPMSILYGAVQDFETGSNVLNAEVEIYALDGSVGVDKNLKSNKGDGSFYAVLPQPAPYLVQVKHNYYQEFKDTVFLQNKTILDTIQCKLFPEGYVPQKERIPVLTLDLNGFDPVAMEDSFCVLISEKLQAYSGRIVGIYVMPTEKESIDTTLFKASSQMLMQCFFKMGVTENYVKFEQPNFDDVANTPSINVAPLHKNEITIAVEVLD